MDQLFPTTSVELYAACRSADRQQQTAGYEALWPHVLRAAYFVVRDQADAEALAQDCAQRALVRVHTHLPDCREPAAFRVWAQRIATRLALDELRQRKRLLPLGDDEADEAPGLSLADPQTPLETEAVSHLDTHDLQQLIERAPISERSRRVVVGRYFADAPDEVLAHTESNLSGQTVLPSHVQVTRTKDIARLRAWQPLLDWLKPDR